MKVKVRTIDKWFLKVVWFFVESKSNNKNGNQFLFRFYLGSRLIEIVLLLKKIISNLVIILSSVIYTCQILIP